MKISRKTLFNCPKVLTIVASAVLFILVSPPSSAVNAQDLARSGPLDSLPSQTLEFKGSVLNYTLSNRSNRLTVASGFILRAEKNGILRIAGSKNIPAANIVKNGKNVTIVKADSIFKKSRSVLFEYGKSGQLVRSAYVQLSPKKKAAVLDASSSSTETSSSSDSSESVSSYADTSTSESSLAYSSDPDSSSSTTSTSTSESTTTTTLGPCATGLATCDSQWPVIPGNENSQTNHASCLGGVYFACGIRGYTRCAQGAQDLAVACRDGCNAVGKPGVNC